MDLKLEVYYSLCSTATFSINGVKASASDFGSSYDKAPKEGEKYGCGNRVFRKSNSSQDILDKYSVTEQEYNQIADSLESKLSFGRCSWCV
jgi:hypothetical protein